MNEKISETTRLQQQHRQEKKDAANHHRKQAGTAQLERKIGSTICNCCPELRSLWDAKDTDGSASLNQRLSDITAVLAYFHTHPRILESIRSGLLK